MYTLTIKGVSKDFGNVNSQAEGFSKVCESKEEVGEILEKFKKAESGSVDAEPSVTIVGQGSHIEVRREGSDLFLYDKMNLNIQGLKVSPKSAFEPLAEGSSLDSEDSKNSGNISSSGLDRKALGILLGIGLVVSSVVQAFIFISENPDPVQPVRPTNITGQQEIEKLKSETVGTYIESSGNLNFGIRINEDGSYEFLDITTPTEGTPQGAPFEKGTYQFGKLRGSPVLLFQEQSLAQISTEGLEFYGYSLSKVSSDIKP